MALFWRRVGAGRRPESVVAGGIIHGMTDVLARVPELLP
jgi:hypothetical protein